MLFHVYKHVRKLQYAQAPRKMCFDYTLYIRNIIMEIHQRQTGVCIQCMGMYFKQQLVDTDV